MIGTIRKHSNWLWYPIIIATIITFVLWGASQALFSNRSGGGDFGKIYGKNVSAEAFMGAKKDFFLTYWFGSGRWPDDAAVSATEMKQQVYLNLLLTQKAAQMGIHVSDDEAAVAASDRLQSLGRNGQVITLDMLVDQVLTPKGFTAADFENFIRHDMMIRQLVQSVGTAGQLITPQEAREAYVRENEELSCQVVFFSASNYLASVATPPGVIGQFYTNYQAQYRLPDRVQVNYVAFSVSNYLAQARAEWAKTNLSETVDAYLQKLGDNYKGAKSAAEARQTITSELLESRALLDAKKDASALAVEAFKGEPVKAENLATVANQKGLILHQSAPFAKETGPAELDGAANFTKAAFGLTSDTPMAGPITDGSSVYVIALVKNLPSEIPPFDKIRQEVTRDYQERQATMLAQQAGQSFYQLATNQVSASHGFAAVAVGLGHTAVTLPPFAISTQDLPELGTHATLGEIKQAAFTSSPGQLAPFVPTSDGGFVLQVKSKLPVDQTKLAANLPSFTESLRRTRENEAFNQWLQIEAAANMQMPKTSE